MPTLNRAIVIGHAGRAPELRYTPNGKAVCDFSVATNRKSGETTETEWHSVVVWDKQAEFLDKHLTKGGLVYVEGRLQTRTWDDKEGQKRSNTEIIADRVLLLDRKTAEDGVEAEALPW